MTRVSRRSKSAVTLRAVAAHAGVSPMSVSNVLNGRSVSSRINEAVQRAIEELNYTPNQAARQLASAAPMFIGLVYSNDEHPLSSALLTGALTAAARLGVQLLLQPIVYSEIDKGWQIVEALRNRGAEAILVPPTFGEAMTLNLQDGDIDFPMICVGPTGPTNGISSVRIDNSAAAREITAILIAKGHTRIGFIRAPDSLPWYECRTEGYRSALMDHGLPCDPEIIVDGGFTYQTALAAAATLLDLEYPPTAIFAWNDEIAAGVLTMAHTRKVPVPEKLAIAGFDGSYFAQRLWPALTSVKVPMVEMAESAVEQLVHLLRSGSANSIEMKVIYLQYDILRRASTGD